MDPFILVPLVIPFIAILVLRRFIVNAFWLIFVIWILNVFFSSGAIFVLYNLDQSVSLQRALQDFLETIIINTLWFPAVPIFIVGALVLHTIFYAIYYFWRRNIGGVFSYWRNPFFESILIFTITIASFLGLFLVSSTIARSGENCFAAIGYEKDQCLSNKAVKNLDDSICEQIKDQLTQETCYFELAVKKDDTSLCERIEVYQSMKGDCFSKLRNSN